MKKFLMILLIFGVLLISGCTKSGGGGGTTATTGVIIKSFSPSISEIDPDIDIVLPIIIKNAGEKAATNVIIQLYGLTNDWKFTSGARILDTIPSMSPADSSRGIEGQEEYRDWVIQGPPKPVKLSYNIEARVSYAYETDSESLIRAVNTKYYREKNDKGGLQSTKYTGGPLVVNVKVPSAIISGGSIPVIFEIQNTGGGITTSMDIMNKIAIEPKGVDCYSKTEITLVDGKSGVVSCRILPGHTIERFEDFPVSIKLKYNYYVSSVSQITILPKIEIS